MSETTTDPRVEAVLAEYELKQLVFVLPDVVADDVCDLAAALVDLRARYDVQFAEAAAWEARACELERECKRLREDAAGICNVLGFFASAIKCGEPWTPECDEMLRAAFAHRDAAITRTEEDGR